VHMSFAALTTKGMFCHRGNVCVWLQFLCLKNIRSFLHSCKDVFGLKEPELFDPFDLFDIRDFGKVYRLFICLFVCLLLQFIIMMKSVTDFICEAAVRDVCVCPLFKVLFVKNNDT